MILQEPVQAAIWHCLNNYDYKDAVFLSERLCSEVETDETIFLLATSYFQSNMLHQAYWLLREKACRSPKCRFLQSKCAYQLKKYAEAECVLTCNGFGNPKYLEEIIKDFGDIACFALQLVARISMKTERNRIASEALYKALKLNPFMWDCFVELCHLGEDVDVASIFKIENTDIFKTSLANSHVNGLTDMNLANWGLNDSNGGVSLLNDSGQNNVNFGQIPTDDANTLNNSTSNTILSTPIDQQLPNANLITPTNLYTNLNSAITMNRNISSTSATVQPNQNASLEVLDDTPVGCAGTPFRKQFKYLSTYMPPSPSFGILPLQSPIGADTFNPYNFNHGLQSNMNVSITSNTTSPSTLAEVNQEHKVLGKKIKSNTSGLGHRRDNIASGQNRPPVFSQTCNITPRAQNHINVGATANGIGNATVRRSSRLFGNSNYSVKENNKTPSITHNTKFVQPRSPPRKTKSRISKILLNNEILEDRITIVGSDKLIEKNYKNKEKIETVTTADNLSNYTTEDAKVLFNNSLNNAQTLANHVMILKKQSADGLMVLLSELAEGYKKFELFQCNAAIKHFETTIPKHQLCTSWVQSIIAVSYYELREYDAAIQIFKRIHENEPHRLQYLEIYSSALWHLQREVELSALTQDLVSQDKTSPITWCVAGNCFSLHKEHDTAIKFFKRAVQVDPDFVYSYTLLGHELVLTEELDKAMDYFRSAVVRDPRHYNAWFGIGTIYSKQEKYELAELHYIKAFKVNPQNSVLLVHIGAMQYYMQKKELALQTLNTAALLEPKNPLARFHRGSIYYSLGRHQEALQELQELKEIVPKESVVFYLIGKIHKALGNIDLALMHFSWATDLDPKGANNQIKDAFDSMSQSNCPQLDDTITEADLDPISEPSDDSIQAQQEYSYDSDVY